MFRPDLGSAKEIVVGFLWFSPACGGAVRQVFHGRPMEQDRSLFWLSGFGMLQGPHGSVVLSRNLDSDIEQLSPFAIRGVDVGSRKFSAIGTITNAIISLDHKS